MRAAEVGFAAAVAAVAPVSCGSRAAGDGCAGSVIGGTGAGKPLFSTVAARMAAERTTGRMTVFYPECRTRARGGPWLKFTLPEAADVQFGSAQPAGASRSYTSQ